MTETDLNTLGNEEIGWDAGVRQTRRGGTTAEHTDTIKSNDTRLA